MSRNGFLVISGCPRSGTSVNMDIQRAVHGEEAICGEKFPQEIRKKRRKELLERQDDEPFHVWQIRKYSIEKTIQIEEDNLTEHEKRFRDMNPEGFYEMPFTTKGITYKPPFKKLLTDIHNGEFKIVKVVSQGLMKSDPSYIRKIIYTIRHPRAVAKSQERLVRGFQYIGDDGKSHNSFEDMVIHTPEMFINVTAQASLFLLQNPEIPIRFYNFEDLISKPKEIIDDMQEFVGFGNYKKSYDIVQPRLNRSKHEDIESTLWDEAEFVYEKFCKAAEIINTYNGDDPEKLKETRDKAEPHLKAIHEYLSDAKKNINRENTKWFCPRAKRTVIDSMCKLCRECGDTMRNFREFSERQHDEVYKHWSKEPCLFECGYDIDREEDEYISIEASIKNNFWRIGYNAKRKKK